MRNIGFDKFYIEIIETLDVEEELDLRVAEGVWIETFINSGFKVTNQQIPKGYWKDPTYYRKLYYETNKNRISEQQKQYLEINKEKIKTQRKEYRDKNKEIIRSKDKEYGDRNREKIREYKNQKIECGDCGKMISRSNMSAHRKSNNCSKKKDNIV